MIAPPPQFLHGFHFFCRGGPSAHWGLSTPLRAYSWVSRGVIISLGVNSKSMHGHRREIVFTVCVDLELGSKYVQFREIYLTLVQHNHQYILG